MQRGLARSTANAGLCGWTLRRASQPAYPPLIFSENIFPNEAKIGKNKISFSIETKNFILGKMKTQ